MFWKGLEGFDWFDGVSTVGARERGVRFFEIHFSRKHLRSTKVRTIFARGLPPLLPFAPLPSLPNAPFVVPKGIFVPGTRFVRSVFFLGASFPAARTYGAESAAYCILCFGGVSKGNLGVSSHYSRVC
jgi:hypothetical protein